MVQRQSSYQALCSACLSSDSKGTTATNLSKEQCWIPLLHILMNRRNVSTEGNQKYEERKQSLPSLVMNCGRKEEQEPYPAAPRHTKCFLSAWATTFLIECEKERQGVGIITFTGSAGTSRFTSLQSRVSMPGNKEGPPVSTTRPTISFPCSAFKI